MRKLMFAVILLMLAILPAACFAGIVIPYLSGNVTPDGQVNDPGWVGQPVYSFGEPYACFDNRVDSANEAVSMDWRLGCTNQGIYFHTEVKDKQIVAKPWANYRGADLCIIGWSNGTTEKVVLAMPTVGMMLLTPGSEILTSTSGAFATKTTTDGYAMEGFLPYADIGSAPGNGKIKLALVQRNWNDGQPDYTATGSVSTAVFVTAGARMWEDAEIATSPSIPVVSAEVVKNMPENVTIRVNQMLWHVTFADTTRFICEDPRQRIKAIEVVWSNQDRPVTNDLVLSLTGRMIAGRFHADAVDFLHGSGKSFTVKPWGLTSRAIGPLVNNLMVKMTGTVKYVSPDGEFTISDGGSDLRARWTVPMTVGQIVTIAGVMSKDASGSILLATDVVSY